MRAKEYLKLRGLNMEVEKVELSVDSLASIMEQYADGMVHERVKSVDLADVGGNEVELCDYCDKRPHTSLICGECLQDPNVVGA